MTLGNNASEKLKQIINRIENVEGQKKTLADDIKQIYLEARSDGFDTKIIRKVVALRKKESAARDEEQALLDTYMAALGMIADLPLGRAALEREGLT